MMITPMATPVATINQNQVNQSQQNQTHQAEQSKQASETVRFSSEARHMAGAELQNKQGAGDTSTAPQYLAENEAIERAADSEAVEQRRPVNPLSGQPATTKIDILA
jgi:hypothetical protein